MPDPPVLGESPPNQDEASQQGVGDEAATPSTEFGAGEATWQVGRELSGSDFMQPPRWIERLPKRAAFQSTIPSRLPRLRGGSRGIDWRRTARMWARAGRPGLHFTSARTKRQPGRVVLLWDVSGSMVDVRDVCLAFAYGMVQRFDQAAVFPFGTRVEEATSALRQAFPIARAKLARLEQLWAGGTDIGGVLTEFIRRFGGRWLRPETTVVVLSDGWDAGQPQVLSTAIRAMRQAGCTVFWLNPLQGTPGFQPKTRALRAVKPWVAGMYPAATPEDFLRFARYIQA